MPTVADQLRAEGFRAGQQKLVLELLDWRFGPLLPEIEDRVAKVGTDKLKLWAMRLLHAYTLKEVFETHERPRIESAESFVQTLADRIKAEGRSDGLREGYNEGYNEGHRKIFLPQLARRFGTLPPEIEERVASATMDELEQWAMRLLDACSLADIFGLSEVPGECTMLTVADKFRAEGRREAFREAFREGRSEERREIVRKLLAERFGTLPPDIEARLARADMGELNDWARRLLDARSLDEVFAA